MARLSQANGKWVEHLLGETQEGAELHLDETVHGEGRPATHLLLPSAIHSRASPFDVLLVGAHADALLRSVPPLRRPCFPASPESLA